MDGSDTRGIAGPSYRLKVKDFGPITAADLTLLPLTVLVGPSNTGKSYLATLVYALHRCFRDQGRFPDFPDQDAPHPDLFSLGGLGKWAKAIASAPAEASDLPAFPASVESYVRSFLEAAPGVGRRLGTEMARCFGVARVQDLVRQPQTGVAQSEIEIEIPRPSEGGVFGYDIALNGDGLVVAGHIRGHSNLASDQVDSVHTQSLSRHVSLLGQQWSSHPELPPAKELDHVLYMRHVFHLLTETVRSWLVRPLGAYGVHYLPSDRAGMSHCRDVVVSSLLHRATTAASGSDALLSGVAVDFLDQLVRLGGEDADADPTGGLLANHLEEAVLEGKVRVEDSDTGFPHILYRPSGWMRDLPLMRTSSMVSELASIVLYLRYLVRPGDLLIIDEPEAHLHPATQTVLAREVIRWVLGGCRVVVTTHSEWFLEQIANRVVLDAVPAENRTGIEESGIAIDADDVGVWLFELDGKGAGSCVKKLGVDPDSGLFPTDHDAVSEALYNEGARILNRQQHSSA